MPDTEVILNPNALVSNSGWRIVGTSSSVTAISDSSGSTYIAGQSNSDYAKYGCSSFTVPAFCQLKTIRLYAYCQSTTSGYTQILCYVASSDFDIDSVLEPKSYASTREWKSSFGFAGYFPSQAAIDSITVAVTPRTGGSEEVVIGKLYLVLVINKAPVVSNVRPSSYANSPNVLVQWTYSDPEGDPQSWYFLKVFSVSQYSASGFNPDTSSAVYSQEVASTATSKTVSSLSDGRYRFYVKSADTTSKRYGYWAYSEAEVRDRYIQSVA